MPVPAAEGGGNVIVRGERQRDDEVCGAAESGAAESGAAESGTAVRLKVRQEGTI